MDIYAKAGTKVKFLDTNGYDNDLERAREYFKKDDVLTVTKTVVGGFSTDVYFEECPGEYFNSVMFTEI